MIAGRKLIDGVSDEKSETFVSSVPDDDFYFCTCLCGGFFERSYGSVFGATGHFIK